MKVLLAHNFYRTSAPSGEDVVVRNEASMLAKRYEVIEYFKHNDDLDEGSVRRRVSMAANAVWSRDSFVEVQELIREHRPSIVHVHNTFPQISPSIYLAAKSAGVPVVQTLHNYRTKCANGLLLRNGQPCELCINSSFPYPAIVHKCYRGSVSATAVVAAIQMVNGIVGSYRKHVNVFVALTEFARRKLQANELADARFLIKPNFLPNPPAEGSHPRKRQALFVGRLTEEKGIWTLLRAWPRDQRFELIVVGDGALREELEVYSRREALKVSFLGHCDRERVLSLLRASALQVIPSICYEGFPMVVLEAYASGTAVLASRLGGLAEVVIEGSTGKLFTAGDAQDLRAQIVNMLDSDNLEMLGRAGRKLFEQRYTEERNLDELAAIYCVALQGSGSF